MFIWTAEGEICFPSDFVYIRRKIVKASMSQTSLNVRQYVGLVQKEIMIMGADRVS